MVIINILFGAIIYGFILTIISLGLAQPIGAICRLIATKRKDSKYAIGLKRYLLSVFLYFLILSIINERLHYLGWHTINLIYLFIVPIFYAIWYISFTRKWKIKKKNIEAYDEITKLQAPNKDRLLLDSFPKKKVKYQYPNYNKLTIKLQNRRAVLRTLPNSIQVK